MVSSQGKFEFGISSFSIFLRDKNVLYYNICVLWDEYNIITFPFQKITESWLLIPPYKEQEKTDEELGWISLLINHD